MASPGIRLKPPQDSDAERNRFARLASSLLSLTFLLGGPLVLMYYIGSRFGFENIGVMLSLLIGYAIGMYFAIPLMFERMLIYVPEWMAYVSLDPFTGKMVPYGQGMHWSHWWEQRNKEGSYSLRVATQPFELSIPTTSTDLTVKGVYQFAISLANITRAIGLEESTLAEGLTSFLKAFLTGRWTKTDAEDVRKRVEDFNDAISAHFLRGAAGEESPSEIDEKYGIISVSVVIEDIDFPEEVQKSRNAVSEAETQLNIIAKLRGQEPEDVAAALANGRITEEQYRHLLSRAMALSNQNTKIDIKVIEGSWAEIAGLLVEAARALSGERKGGAA